MGHALPTTRCWSYQKCLDFGIDLPHYTWNTTTVALEGEAFRNHGCRDHCVL